MKYFIGLFFVLHGLVHLLYMGHSLRFFELEKNFIWPDRSIFLKNRFSLETNRKIAAGACIFAAVSFVLAGIRVLIHYSWGYGEITAAAVISSLTFILFWDGTVKKLHTQGGIAILINLAMLTIAYKFKG